jgi:hypothetical protein
MRACMFSLVCASGFVYIYTACYYLGSTPVTWYAANATCNSLGTEVHLATISSAAEQAAILAYYGTSITAWIGLNCITTHASIGTAGEVWMCGRMAALQITRIGRVASRITVVEVKLVYIFMPIIVVNGMTFLALLPLLGEWKPMIYTACANTPQV